jgi:predicted Zn finger-like uncharacterized protein
MKTQCPHCNQHYDVDDSFIEQEVTCQNCNQIFKITAPLIEQKIPATPATIQTEPDQKIKKNQTGAFYGCVICLILAIVANFFSNFLIIIWAPLYLAAFVLSIVSIAQRNVFAGIITLLASVIAPGVFIIINIVLGASAISQALKENPPPSFPFKNISQAAKQFNQENSTTIDKKNVVKPVLTVAQVELSKNDFLGLRFGQNESSVRQIIGNLKQRRVDNKKGVKEIMFEKNHRIAEAEYTYLSFYDNKLVSVYIMFPDNSSALMKALTKNLEKKYGTAKSSMFSKTIKKDGLRISISNDYSNPNINCTYQILEKAIEAEKTKNKTKKYENAF